jgi:hypothetical protein
MREKAPSGATQRGGSVLLIMHQFNTTKEIIDPKRGPLTPIFVMNENIEQAGRYFE